MPRIRDPNRDKAFEIYKEQKGNIDLVEIANQLNVPPGTVRGWKAKDKWEDKMNGTFQKNTERSKRSKTERIEIDDGTKETLENDSLTEQQKWFCIYYNKSFNATQSYLKAYGCSYATAMVEGCNHLRNPKIRAELDRLKEIKRQAIAFSEQDLVEYHMRIAFADMGDYLSFGSSERPVMEDGEPLKDDGGEQVTQTVSFVSLKESSQVDTQLIKEVKQGRDGIAIKLVDRCKSIDWLDNYFNINPFNKLKEEYERNRNKIAQEKHAKEMGDNNNEELSKLDKVLEEIKGVI